MDEETTRLVERIRLEDGASQDDLPFIERTLTQLFTQLTRFDALDGRHRAADQGPWASPGCARRSRSTSVGCPG